MPKIVMPLILLMFFGPFVLGGFARRMPILRSASYSWIAAVAIGAAAASLFLLYYVPFFAVWSELLIALVSSLTIALIMSAMSTDEDQESGPQGSYGCLSLLLVVSLPLVSFSVASRVGQAQKLAPELDGLVSYKYHSRNHNQPVLVVTRSDGISSEIEGVDALTWDGASVGRSHLRKPAWSAYGQLDGKSVRIVRKAGFIGTLPD